MAELALRTPYEREQMRERLASKRDEDIADAQRRRMNEGFVQVYPKGWARMRELLRETKSQAPLLLYTFIAEHIDADGGVLVADQRRSARLSASVERRSGGRSPSWKSEMPCCGSSSAAL